MKFSPNNPDMLLALTDVHTEQGVHLYIFLSPRTHLSPVAHALAYGVHVLIFVLLRDSVAA